ncbi:hypothetical protein HELRODRAFT_180527 [Helobdella robusta]|uniref:DUF4456 domain-containing protein n=1 Tax=Helobdella robusta TaxID=6412 RepID=T1FG07_HELRO|nr:hypothetical protein HELRODRAFT_180527 [Helobdella robusta]ESN93874.1 hypothetical protein HELRODRAFT_180527 [Helobdella robusta]
MKQLDDIWSKVRRESEKREEEMMKFEEEMRDVECLRVNKARLILQECRTQLEEVGYLTTPDIDRIITFESQLMMLMIVLARNKTIVIENTRGTMRSEPYRNPMEPQMLLQLVIKHQANLNGQRIQTINKLKEVKWWTDYGYDEMKNIENEVICFTKNIDDIYEENLARMCTLFSSIHHFCLQQFYIKKKKTENKNKRSMKLLHLLLKYCTDSSKCWREGLLRAASVERSFFDRLESLKDKQTSVLNSKESQLKIAVDRLRQCSDEKTMREIMMIKEIIPKLEDMKLCYKSNADEQRSYIEGYYDIMKRENDVIIKNILQFLNVEKVHQELPHFDQDHHKTTTTTTTATTSTTAAAALTTTTTATATTTKLPSPYAYINNVNRFALKLKKVGKAKNVSGDLDNDDDKEKGDKNDDDDGERMKNLNAYKAVDKNSNGLNGGKTDIETRLKNETERTKNSNHNNINNNNNNNVNQTTTETKYINKSANSSDDKRSNLNKNPLTNSPFPIVTDRKRTLEGILGTKHKLAMIDTVDNVGKLLVSGSSNSSESVPSVISSRKISKSSPTLRLSTGGNFGGGVDSDENDEEVMVKDAKKKKYGYFSMVRCYLKDYRKMVEVRMADVLSVQHASVFHSLLHELKLHRDRLQSHQTAVDQRIIDMKNSLQRIVNAHDRLFEEFQQTLQRLQRQADAAKHSSILQKYIDKCKNHQRSNLETMKEEIRCYVAALDDEVVKLNRSNDTFRRSFKLFIDGGNYCTGEVQACSKDLGLISGRVDGLVNVVMKEVEVMEAYRCQQSFKCLVEFEARYKPKLADLQFVENCERMFQQLRSKINKEISTNKEQCLELHKSLMEFKGLIDSCVDGSVINDNERILTMLQKMIHVNTRLERRARYLASQTSHPALQTNRDDTNLDIIHQRPSDTHQSALRISKPGNLATNEDALVNVIRNLYGVNIEEEYDRKLSSKTKTPDSSKSIKSTERTDTKSKKKYQTRDKITSTATAAAVAVTTAATVTTTNAASTATTTASINGNGNTLSGIVLEHVGFFRNKIMALAEAYYKSKGRRQVSDLCTIKNTFDDFKVHTEVNQIEKVMNDVTECRETSIKEFESQCTQMMSTCVNMAECFLNDLYKVTMSTFNEKYLSQVKEVQEFKAESVKERCQHELDLRPTLGHPQNGEKLFRLVQKERFRNNNANKFYRKMINNIRDSTREFSDQFIVQLTAFVQNLFNEFDKLFEVNDTSNEEAMHDWTGFSRILLGASIMQSVKAHLDSPTNRKSSSSPSPTDDGDDDNDVVAADNDAVFVGDDDVVDGDANNSNIRAVINKSVNGYNFGKKASAASMNNIYFGVDDDEEEEEDATHGDKESHSMKQRITIAGVENPPAKRQTEVDWWKAVQLKSRKRTPAHQRCYQSSLNVIEKISRDVNEKLVELQSMETCLYCDQKIFTKKWLASVSSIKKLYDK